MTLLPPRAGIVYTSNEGGVASCVREEERPETPAAISKWRRSGMARNPNDVDPKISFGSGGVKASDHVADIWHQVCSQDVCAPPESCAPRDATEVVKLPQPEPELNHKLLKVHAVHVSTFEVFCDNISHKHIWQQRDFSVDLDYVLQSHPVEGPPRVFRLRKTARCGFGCESAQAWTRRNRV